MDRTDMVLESEHETIIELVDLIGAEHTQKLVDTFSGSHIYIPQLKNIAGEYKNQNIYDDFLSGMSYIELRHKYKLSEKTIRAIVNVEREKKKGGQKMNENTEQVQETESIQETAPLNDYNRESASNRYGTAKKLGNAVQSLKLTQDKSFTFTIDRGNHEDTVLANSAGNALQR